MGGQLPLRRVEELFGKDQLKEGGSNGLKAMKVDGSHVTLKEEKGHSSRGEMRC